jgi:hypothetical protein
MRRQAGRCVQMSALAGGGVFMDEEHLAPNVMSSFLSAKPVARARNPANPQVRYLPISDIMSSYVRLWSNRIEKPLFCFCLGTCPAPFVAATAIAARAQHMRIAPVLALPLFHPPSYTEFSSAARWTPSRYS